MEKKSQRNCTLKKVMNDSMDILEKAALMCGIETDACMNSVFPFEEFWVSIDREKVTGCLKLAVGQL